MRMHACIHTTIHAYHHSCIPPFMHTTIHAYHHSCIPPFMHTTIHAYTHQHITTQLQQHHLWRQACERVVSRCEWLVWCSVLFYSLLIPPPWTLEKSPFAILCIFANSGYPLRILPGEASPQPAGEQR
ncbi:hypothetical protein BZA77DRAFT_306940 [Pyronema omphalodes]|nr:hypothetical protein BZA77DRAFT_306940 [Pyronema omphalodes]